MVYSEQDLLPLSGIQHYCYCPRQWSLINIERAWEENSYTLQGRLIHENVDDISYRNSTPSGMVLRAHPLVSYRLGVYGIADLIELRSTSTASGYFHQKYGGPWDLYPVEYKRGKPKETECDITQLCAQGMCLEEMYGIEVQGGAVFYHAIRRRMEVNFTHELRDKVKKICESMHADMASGFINPITTDQNCKGCSLQNICIPEFKTAVSPTNYNKRYLNEEAP